MTFPELEECKRRVDEGKKLQEVISKIDAYVSDLELHSNIDNLSISYSQSNGGTQWISYYNIDASNADINNELKDAIIAWLIDTQNKYLEKFKNL